MTLKNVPFFISSYRKSPHFFPFSTHIDFTSALSGQSIKSERYYWEQKIRHIRSMIIPAVKITMKKLDIFLVSCPALLGGDKKMSEFFFIANFQWFTGTVCHGRKRVWIFNAWIIFIRWKNSSPNARLKCSLWFKVYGKSFRHLFI